MSRVKLATTNTGIKAVTEKLWRVRSGVRGPIMRRSLAAYDQVLLPVVKANTPQESGLAAKSLGRKEKIYRNSATGVGLVGPRHGFDQNVFVTFDRRGRRVAAPSATKRAVRLVLASGTRKGVVRRYNPTKYFHLIEGGRREVGPIEKRVLSSGLQVFGRKSPAVTGRRPLQRAQEGAGASAEAAFVATMAAGIVQEIG